MLCSRFLRPPGEAHGRLYTLSERGFDGMLRTYDWTLRGGLRHRRVPVAMLGLTLVRAASLFWIIPKGFIPTEDTGQIFAFTEAAQDVSFDAMMEHQLAVNAIVRGNPHVEQFFSANGASGINIVPNTGRLFIRLKPHGERPPVDRVIEELRPKLQTGPGTRVYPQNLPLIRIGGQLPKALSQPTLPGTDLHAL